jgi:hypothetical protein
VVEPGRRCLGDRYELQRLIAAGGMGQVWRAFDIALHRLVAVKVLRSEYTGDPTFLARFRVEAQHAASLSHPNIAAVFDYGEEIAQDGTGETLAYLVMELVEGEPLSALLAREGPLDTATTLSLLRQTAFALGDAHRAGMVHRDVKPGNILVRPDGSVKITDFGIAWSARSVALTRTGQVIGTPQYLSPEQAEGRPATPASDVYALGLIGYECLAGHPAFDGDNAVTIALKQVRQEPEPLPAVLPAGVRGLIVRALAKDPRARLRDGSAFVAAIEDIAAGRPILPPPATVSIPAASGSATGGTRSVAAASGPMTHPPAPRRRGRGVMVLLPLLGLLAGAAIAVALLQALTHSPPRGTAQAAEQHSTTGIVLVARDYVGHPVDDVAAQLLRDGLAVRRQVDTSSGAAPGMVTRVDPVGTRLSPGDTVTVFYVPDPSRSSSGVGDAGVSAAALTGSAGATDGAAASASRSAAATRISASGTPTLAGESTGSDTATSGSATETTSASDSSSATTTAATDSTAASSSSPTSP